MAIRLLTILSLGTLLVGALYVAQQRLEDAAPAVAVGDAPPAEIPDPATAGPAAARERPAMRVERRFLGNPQTLAQLVRELPGDYRILSCSYNKPLEIWEVKFERPVAAEPSPVARALRQYLDGELPGDQLRIAYGEVFASVTAPSTVRITILGTGEVRQNAFRKTRPRAYAVSRDWVEHLVHLLLELEAWEQYVLVDQQAEPGTSVVTLEIDAGRASSRIWQSPRHRELDDRIAHVADVMKRLAWAEEQIVILGDD